ncbi:MAG: hypothetical protein LQ340_002653 [Diploschistes diacapsis]|nr:MAG: hypothetical protein LQ340_002653 [Diploschistes diacapsis]
MTEPAQEQSQSPAPVRRFPVQPVETTVKHHHASTPRGESTEANGSTPRRKFVPQLEETSERSHRRGGNHADPQRNGPAEETYTVPASASGSGSRRFTPQLVETAKRTRKRGDTAPAMQHTDKTDLSPGDRVHLPRDMRFAQSSSSERPLQNIPAQRTPKQTTRPPESRFSFANLSKKAPRQASFRVPQLAPIASPGYSDKSNESEVPSLSTTPSATSDGSEAQKQARRLRESCDEKFSGYLLALAAQAAKKQLREQALAAFPNERFDQPVDHFAFGRDSEDSDDYGHDGMSEILDVADAMQRRMSATGWDLVEMPKHKEKLEEQRRRQRLADSTAPKKDEPISDPWQDPYNLKAVQNPFPREQPNEHMGGHVRDANELTKMRSAASPPMLGSDLVFVEAMSPQHTMIDATQKPRCRTGWGGEPKPRQHSGLWTPGRGRSPTATHKNSASAFASVSALGPALWAGLCNAPKHETDNLSVPHKSQMQTGIMTPRVEQEDRSPHISRFPAHVLPSSPCPCPRPVKQQHQALANMDAVRTIESSLDDEYPDSFVTQLYNYLSLGYPALARKFDDELSKISRVPVEEIRKGDARMNSKGFIGVPEGEGWAEEEVKGNCGRWWALRLYIREWARQQPRMVDSGRKDWRARARRGSWAI